MNREGREKTNAAYQDAMKTVLSLATASLILPIVLVKTFASEGVPKDHITKSAYISWLLLFLSISACLLFFLASDKYLIILLGGTESILGHNFTLCEVENIRDCTVYVSIPCFLVGIISSFLFFRTLVAGGKPSSVR